MGALKLFISHSSRLDDESVDSNDPEKNPNLKLLLEVIAAIKQEYGNSIDILVDKDEHGLPAGHDWEKRLNEWLAECHVAIILFSKRAIENSNWVKKEATILSWRRELEKDFTLIPVLLDNQATPEDLEKDLFGTLRISKNQCVPNANNSQDILKGIKIALGEKETLEAKCKQTPFDKLECVITKLLTNNADSDTLKEIWETLADSDKPIWHPDSKIRFAHALTSYLLRDSEKCLASFEAVINKIRPKTKQENAKELLEYIRPLWVDAKAAGCIPLALSHKKFVAQNGKLLPQYTFERYTERAWPMDKSYKLVFSTKSEEISLIEEIRDVFKESKRMTLDADQCDARINTFPRQILIYLPASEQDGGGLLDDHLLRTKLKTKYPNVIFVLGTGERLPAVVADDIAKIEPPLDLQLEYNQMIAEANIEDFLTEFYGN
jgi:hypothetical protein